MQTAQRQSRGSSVVTESIRVDVTPRYLTEHSQPQLNKYIFAYRVRISNEGDRWVKLMTRYWNIVDADGERHEVSGEGVVGQQPELKPGESFEYSSHCPLETPWGTMEGTYTFVRDDGASLPVQIGRFFLISPEA